MLFRHIHVIPGLQPVDDSLVITVRFFRISQNGMFTTFSDSFQYKRRSCKVHISHPQRNQIGSSPYFLHAVKLHRMGSPAVDHFIKIISYHISFIYTVSMTKLDINHEELKKSRKKFHERLVFSRKVLLLHP